MRTKEQSVLINLMVQNLIYNENEPSVPWEIGHCFSSISICVYVMVVVGNSVKFPLIYSDHLWDFQGKRQGSLPLPASV